MTEDQKETKREKTLRIMPAKFLRAYKAIKAVEPVTDLNNYEYTPEEVARHMARIREAVRIISTAFDMEMEAKGMPTRINERPQ